MNQIRYFSLLGLFILLCYAAPASLQADSLKEQTLFEKLSGLSKRNRLPHVDLNTRIAYHTALSSQSTEKSAFRVDICVWKSAVTSPTGSITNGCSI